jgi:hypothetical protein
MTIDIVKHVALLAGIIAGFGAMGGIVNSFQTGERNIWPKYDDDLKIWRPGWMGNAFIGAVAAVVVWMVYGPLAAFDLAGSDSSKISLTLMQLGSSSIVGLSGGKILTLLAQQKADQITKNYLAGVPKKLHKPKKEVQ